MTYAQALHILAGFQRFGVRPGLETSFTLATRAGHPERELRFIHVAGTNGKGSTCAMLEAMYRAAGYRTGLYTSPHLVRLGERIQVNRQLISEAELAERVAEALPWTKDLEVTFFEFVTLLALQHFARERCEVVIWETGLGGRWDATNIVQPLASVITQIGLDHQSWLGSTLPEIAAEKAGIIKAGVPVVTGARLVSGAEDPARPEAAAWRVIRERATEVGSPLVSVDDAAAELARAGNPALALLGNHQRQNAAVALAVVRTLQSAVPVSREAQHAGLAGVRWAGRLQSIRRGAATWLLDGAHNLPGVETLVAALEEYFPGRRPALVLGILADKDWEAMCRRLAPRASRVVLAAVASARTADPAALAGMFHEIRPELPVEIAVNAPEALRKVGEEPFVVATGSLYFVGEILEWLENQDACGSERALNEWRANSEPSPSLG